MADPNVMNLKVFLRDDNSSEARRFTVDASVVTSFLFMKEKLQTVFPILREHEFKITWKDMDGDEITIASDEDFITAFTEMSGNVKVLYVTITQRNQEPIFVEAELHGTPFAGPRIVCDICNQLVTGFRYKCLQCPDYDLCTGCEHKGHHSDHLMIRVPNNETYMPKCTRKFMHHVARNLKKSAYVASKEAHRAAKFASKFGGKPSGEENKSEQPQPQTSSNNQAPEGQGCPFSTGEAINMNDIHALGAMARQHLGPLFDVLQTAPQAAAAAGVNPEQGGLFMDIIRNAVDGFFGRIPEETPSSEQNQQQEQQPAQSETQPGQENNATTTPENAPAPAQNQPTPMDIEGNSAKNPIQPPIPNLQRDPGWTFVATNAGQPNNTTVQSSPATAPTLVYHENPRIAEGLVQLHEMGFSNESGYLTHLLERHEGNVAAVVKSIVEMKL